MIENALLEGRGGGVKSPMRRWMEDVYVHISLEMLGFLKICFKERIA